ncbi:hypothetical protein GQX73_g6089 [Xylaria multiplex]|uniref:MADS-box domain-containing protein n=1 Tax=Xylaria multiplex TaxID=323545 RepID=A0A7C8IMH3_9PEZI|nr:hypothetical protein GQX73_g6089 [Xylaria multiplex]
MGRGRIGIKTIKDDKGRSFTFLKRKCDLFTKAHELSMLCSVDVAVIIFDGNKKLYEYSSANMRDLITRYTYHSGPNEHKGPGDFNGSDNDEDKDMEGTPPHSHEGSAEPQMIPPHIQSRPAFPHLQHHTPSASPPINGRPFVRRGHTPQTRSGHRIPLRNHRSHANRSQHLDSFHTDAQSKEEGSDRAQSADVGAVSRLKASNSPLVPQRSNTGARVPEARGSISAVPEGGFTPPSCSNSLNVDSASRPRLRVRISDEASDAGSDAGETATIVSAGATGPPNPFARPPPQTHGTTGAVSCSGGELDQLSPKGIPTIAGAMESFAEQSETSSGELGEIKDPIDKPHTLGKPQNFVNTTDKLGHDTSFESLAPLVKEKLYSTSKCSMDHAVDVLQAANAHNLSAEYSPHATQTTVCSNSIEFIIETHLTLLNHIKRNFSNERFEVSTLVTITGSAFYAYATTCLNYLKSTWPDTGEILLPILQEATQEVLHRPDSTAKISKEHDQLWALSIELRGDGSLKLRAKGSKTFTVDITQQLCWLTATFSTPPPNEENICYCTPKIELIGDSSPAQPIFKLGACFTELHASERNSCWLPLFSNAVIAHGFPIPERADGMGLEMSVELMAGIIGARHAATFDGGVVIKGFSSMFVPVMRTRDGIQWHYVANNDPDMQLSYEEGVNKCPNRLLDLDFASLTAARCFIGWNSGSLVEVRVGDETNNFDDIKFSNAAEVKAALQIPGGSLGFQQFGLAQIDVTFGKRDGKCHFQRSSSYRRIVNAAEKMLVALFDTGKRRSYLVPASGLLLHILRHRLSSGLGGIPASKVEILSASSFTEQLLINAKVRLTSEGDEILFVDDVVSEIWSVLELLQAQSISAEKNSKVEIHATWQERLLGYEYMAVVKDWSPMPLKELEIHKTCGGWPRLIRDVNALVLLANGFGDWIQPIGDQTGLWWKTFPRGKDYMAVPANILFDLYALAGYNNSNKRLTATNLILHGPGTSLFQPCHTHKGQQCSCNRLHQVVSISSFGHICVPELLERNGAVIIGKSSCLLNRLSYRRPHVRSIVTEGIVRPVGS